MWTLPVCMYWFSALEGAVQGCLDDCGPVQRVTALEQARIEIDGGQPAA